MGSLLPAATGAALLDVADHRGDANAMRWSGGALTYAELAGRARAVAAALGDELRPGDRMTILSAHGPEWVVVQLAAALAAGAVRPAGGRWPQLRPVRGGRACRGVGRPRGRQVLSRAGHQGLRPVVPGSTRHPDRRQLLADWVRCDPDERGPRLADVLEICVAGRLRLRAEVAAS